MKLEIEPGEIFADALHRFRPASSWKFTVESDWKWGHIFQLNDVVLTHYKKGDHWIVAADALVNLSNMGEIDNQNLLLRVERHNG